MCIHNIDGDEIRAGFDNKWKYIVFCHYEINVIMLIIPKTRLNYQYFSKLTVLFDNYHETR